MSRMMTMALGLAAITTTPGFSFVEVNDDNTKHRIEARDGRTVKEGMKVLRPQLSTTRSKSINTVFGQNISAKTDAKTGAPRLISGGVFAGVAAINTQTTDKRTLTSQLTTAAESFLTQHHSEMIKRGFSFRLNRDALTISKSEQFLSYDLYLNDTLITDAHVELRFKFGRLVQVQDFAFAEARLPQPARFAAANVTSAIENQLNLENLRFIRKLFRIEATADQYQLLAVAEFSAQSSNGTPFFVQVDLTSGEIFQFHHAYHYGTGHAQADVYPRSWVDEVAIPQPLSEAHIGINANTVTTDATGAFNFSEEGTPKLNGFAGKRVTVRPTTGTLVQLDGIVDPASGVFLIDFAPMVDADVKADKNMAQAMVFDHVNRIIHRAQPFISPDWFNRQLRANVNLSKTCNAFWDGSTINFFSAGGNCANTGLSADVVYHEWGHGLDANTGGISDGAFSEGFGDIMSLVMTGSPELGQGFRTNGKGIRDLDADKVYPRDQGEVHAEGLIIGSTFYDLLQALRTRYGDAAAREKLAYYAFKVITTARRYTDVYDALLVLDDNDADLANLTPNYCMMNQVFAAHGLADKEDRCQFAVTPVWNIQEVQGNGNESLEPGESWAVNLNLTNQTQSDLNELKATLSSVQSFVQFSNNSLAWHRLEPNQSASANSDAVFTVASQAACGAKFSIDAAVSSAEGATSTAKSFVLGRAVVSAPLSSSAINLPQEISFFSTANTSASVTAEQVSEGATVNQLSVAIAFSHERVSDVSIRLTSPSGKSSNISGAVFRDGQYVLEKDVSANFKGEALRGEWKLQVSDSRRMYSGELNRFALSGTAIEYQCQ